MAQRCRSKPAVAQHVPRRGFVFKNIGSNWVVSLASMVAIYFLTPFTIHKLGDDGYGTWNLINAITGYLGLLAFGVPLASVRYFAEHVAQGEWESIALDEALESSGVRLLDALDLRGVAMVECKREVGTGRPVVMEANGRFWGSLQLAIDAGVDFPELLVRCAAGEHVPTFREYRLGVRSRWFWGDVDHLSLRLRDVRHRGGSRLRAFLDFFRVRPGRDRSEIARWRDPAPFLVETLQWLRILPHGT